MTTAQHPRSPRRSSLATLLVVLASAGTLLAATDAAQARERNTTITGANGRTVERSVTRNHGDVSSTTTGPNGKTTSRDVVRDDGTATATKTGPNGKTATRVTTKTDTGSQTTLTGPNGKTKSVTVTH